MRSLRAVALLVLVCALGVSTVSANTAEIQIIHNAPDRAARVVDVYVNGEIALDEFAFRTATEFLELPAGVDLTIGVVPGGGNTTAADVQAEFPVRLEVGERYVAIASGVLDPGAFPPNPEQADIAFNIYARDNIRTSSFWRKTVNIIAFHGAPDAPTVDIVPRGGSNWWWGPFVNNLSYGEFSKYRTLLPRAYTFDVTPADDNNIVVKSFEVDLSGLKGGSAVVFASGFLGASEEWPAFGLFAALPNGDVLELAPEAQTARLQVVHNAADPLASVVDVYVNDDPFIDDFGFREATEFRTVPAGVNLNIGVALGSETTAEDIAADFDVTLEAGKTYIVFANGVLDASNLDPNPEGLDIGFTLFARDGIKESSQLNYLVKLIAFHGATDAPAVDIIANRGWWRWRLFGNLSYGDFSNYRLALPRTYTLDVTPAGDPNTVVKSYTADLRALKGGTAVVFASGFLNPGNTGNGFGLYAVLADGTVAPLPETTNAFATRPLMASGPQLDRETALNQNYPNPFNPQTTISFSLADEQIVRLQVFNARGQLVETLVNESMGVGDYTVNFNADRLASGVYFYKLQAGTFTDTRKMVLLK